MFYLRKGQTCENPNGPQYIKFQHAKRPDFHCIAPRKHTIEINNVYNDLFGS